MSLSRYGTMGTGIVIAVGLVALAACTTETDTGRTQAPGDRDAGGDAAEADAAPAPPDENDGRDDEAASCFAACQNTAFSCQAKAGGQTTLTTAELGPDPGGCVGTLSDEDGESVALKLDCSLRTVCVGSSPGEPATACVPATFSAFSFAYAPGGGSVTNVCTRN